MTLAQWNLIVLLWLSGVSLLVVIEIVARAIAAALPAPAIDVLELTDCVELGGFGLAPAGWPEEVSSQTPAPWVRSRRRAF